jgi:hypothetical protein
VSIKGSSAARFERALATGNPLLVRAAAAELPRVGLPDALAICLLLLEAEPDRYPPAAARWAARFVLEHPGVGVGEAQLVLSSLAALRGAGWVGGSEALVALCRLRRVDRAAEVLDAWAERRRAARGRA